MTDPKSVIHVYIETGDEPRRNELSRRLELMLCCTAFAVALGGCASSPDVAWQQRVAEREQTLGAADLAALGATSVACEETESWSAEAHATRAQGDAVVGCWVWDSGDPRPLIRSVADAIEGALPDMPGSRVLEAGCDTPAWVDLTIIPAGCKGVVLDPEYRGSFLFVRMDGLYEETSWWSEVSDQRAALGYIPPELAQCASGPSGRSHCLLRGPGARVREPRVTNATFRGPDASGTAPGIRRL